MACVNILTTYKDWSKAQKEKGFSREEMDTAWVRALRTKRTGKNLELIEAILEGNNGSLDLAIGYNSPNTNNKGVKFLDARIIDGKYTLFTDKGVYDFDKGETKSLPTEKGTVVHVPVMEMTNYIGEYLGSKSDIGKKVNWDRMTETLADIQDDITKTVGMLDTINDLSGIKADEKQMKHLRGLLGSMNPEFFRKMKVYINENSIHTGGVVQADKIGIMISKARNKAGNTQTAAEVYAHEIVHAYTMFAMKRAKDKKNPDLQARKILDRLEYVMDQAAKEVKWQDFLGVKENVATEEEVTNAKEMYEYIFTSEHAQEEFVAHALTNPLVIKKLKRMYIKDKKEDQTVWEVIKDAWMDIIRYMAGDYSFKDKDKSMYEATVGLAALFAEYNSKAAEEVAKQETLVERLTGAIGDLENETAVKLGQMLDRFSMDGKPLGPVPEDRLGKVKYQAKAMVKMVSDPKYRKVMMTYLDKLGILNVSGSIGSIIRDFSEADKLEKTIDYLQLAADKIDQSKMNIITTVKDGIKQGFKDQLTTEQDEALTGVVLDTALTKVFDDKSANRWKKILTDEDALRNAQIVADKELKRLSNNSDYNWHSYQARGLGYFMATGKGHVAQNLNTYNIARGYMSGNEKKPYTFKKGDLESALDMVATLEALKHVSKKEKNTMVAMMDADIKGVKNFVHMAKAAEKEAKDTIFKDQEAFIIQGYSKELYEDGISVEVAKLSAEKEMHDKGYKLVSEAKGHSLIGNTEKYGIYISTNYSQADWHRSTTRMTKNRKKGTSLRDIWYNEGTTYDKKKFLINRSRINTEAAKIAKQMHEGTLDLSKLEHGLMPVMNADGEVVDYRAMMDKKSKKELLKQDKRATEVLSATRGTILDKQRSEEHNKNVLKLIKEDAEANYVEGQSIGKEGVEYILISEDHEKAEVRDLWNVMPREFKTEAMRNRGGVLPVRKDMLHNYFGYREASFANFPGLEKIMPTVLKNAIKVAEAIWQEFIKIVKVDILIKMPFVIVGNIVSNMLYAITTGTSPTTIMGDYTKSIRDARRYLTRHREMIKIEEEANTILADKDYRKNQKKMTKLKQLQTRVKLIKNELESSEIHELYELGVYQAIVEDISKEEMSSKNKLKDKYNKGTEKIPKVIKDGMNWLYLTEETQYYKFMTEVLQMSDLVARDIENKKMKRANRKVAQGRGRIPNWYIHHLKTSDDKEARIMKSMLNDGKLYNTRRKLVKFKDLDEKKYFERIADDYRKQQVLNNFINYNKVSGPTEEYLNKMGFVMFTKYAKRVQRVIFETGGKYPFKSMAMIMVNAYAWDMDMIQDQSIFTRSWYNMTPQMPWDRVLEVMEPALIQMPDNLGLAA